MARKELNFLNAWVNSDCNETGFLQCPELNDARIVQAFSNRKAGNMALHTGDDAVVVKERHDRFLRCLGLEDYCLTAAYQVHGTRVAVVDSVYPGKTIKKVTDLIPETDALICREPGLALATFTADCMPIFYYDQQTPAIGIAHAGWRGTIDGIARLTLEKMVETFGTEPASCRIALGPAICTKCFQVGTDLADTFSERHPESVKKTESGYFVDLAAFNAALLHQAGVPKEAIVSSNQCTFCDPGSFFSHRATKTTGRMMGIIALRGGCHFVKD